MTIMKVKRRRLLEIGCILTPLRNQGRRPGGVLQVWQRPRYQDSSASGRQQTVCRRWQDLCQIRDYRVGQESASSACGTQVCGQNRRHDLFPRGKDHLFILFYVQPY